MSRVVTWLQYRELAVFHYVNGRPRGWLDWWLNRITHLGGATATLLITLCLSIFASEPWNVVAMQSFIALALSHIPVAVIKKKYPRLRPYLVLPDTNICKKPLTDHSFPSGHTTAIFSVTVPFMAAAPVLSLVLLPLALTVALSRMYLGLHYPSDCAAGAFLGTLAALLSCTVI
ncbi:phosphatase PAP2 family protein [Gorillibacterium sp. sgz5001074]|uniref:phosphatase PAP2 family protein n=1 Tax=Gorillibacterium sp. sgz5001074 TaxID=3446695 RepID=UPI003F681E59